MTNSKQNAFDMIIQDVSDGINNVEKSLVLTQIERYSINDSTNDPIYAPHPSHCHRSHINHSRGPTHGKHTKQQGVNIIDDQDLGLTGELVWFNGANWTDVDC